MQHNFTKTVLVFELYNFFNINFERCQEILRRGCYCENLAASTLRAQDSRS